MATVITKIVISAPRAQAPTVGTHLPYCRDTMAARMTNQMKTTAYTYFQAPPTFPKSSSIAANETMMRVPPTQIGLEIQ
jgi:hypothetical protein